MKTFAIFFISVVLGISAIGQDFYYSDNRKIYLEKAEHWLTVQVTEDGTEKFKDETLDKFDLKERLRIYPEHHFFWVEKRDGSKIDVNNLTEETNIVRTFPAYYNICDVVGDTIHFIITDFFHVRFADDVSIEDVKKMNEQYFVEIISTGFDNQYILRLIEKSPLTTLEAANIYYEDDLTIWSLPSFLTKTKDLSRIDPYFDDQWHLYNTGQGGGVSGIDINVLPAWDFTTGSENIIVAVAEDGAVGQHEDFSEGQIITGYHAQNQSDHTLGFVSDHAVCVGGIIIANHNNIGVRGVAPNAKIMPIVFGGATTERIAKAIDTIYHRGADIINISWGFFGENIWHDDIAQALQRAMTNGRNGKGTVVVNAAGNDSYVMFPATVPGVLTVGAVTNLDNPAYYTPYSDYVDIVAPSHGGTLDITTTDRHPPYGYDPDYKYNFDFDYTSAAAPQASGVAALILSINPNLTELQVRNIIKQSATSYGQTNWAGYGRLNAYEAIKKVKNMIKILGPDELKEEDGCVLYEVTNVYQSQISWDWQPSQALEDCSPPFSPNNRTHVEATSHHCYPTTITATISNENWNEDILITKNVFVGECEQVGLLPPPILQGPMVDGHEVNCLYPNQQAYMIAHPPQGYVAEQYLWELKYGNYTELLGTGQTSDLFSISDPNLSYQIRCKAHYTGEGWSPWATQYLFFCNVSGNYTFIVYPNPAQNKFYIDVSTGGRGKQGGGYQPDDDPLFTVRLYDWGSYLVLTDSFYKSEAPHAVDVSHLEKGKYILHILHENNLLHSQQVVLN